VYGAPACKKKKGKGLLRIYGRRGRRGVRGKKCLGGKKGEAFL